MTNPTPRDAAPSDVQRLQAVNDAMAGIDQVGELPLDDAFARLEAVHRALAEALNPGEERREETPGGEGHP